MTEQVEDLQEVKTCSNCGKTKPLTDFQYISTQKKYRGQCKECIKEKQINWARARGVMPRKSPINLEKGTKICSGCKKEKPLGEFYYNAKRNTYYYLCKDCEKINAQERRRKNGIKSHAERKQERWEQKQKELAKGVKICNNCGVEKPLDDFYFSIKRGKENYSSWCKACMLAYHKERRQGSEGDAIRERDRKNRELHKDEVNAKNRERYASDPEKYRGYKLKWRNAHYDDYLRQAKEQRLKHIDRVKAYKKQYDLENKDKKKKWDKKYRDTHHEQRNEYSRMRKENDPLFKLKHQIGTLVLQSLKKGGYKKKTKTADILGCDYATFFDHLKASWLKNYGTEWNGEPYHIDHIIPLATAKTEQDVIDLCHYTNLQMLKPEDNMDKKDKLDWTLEREDK